MEKQNYISYPFPYEEFRTRDDQIQNGEKPTFKELDIKLKQKLQRVRDLVLFRYGSTGVREAIKAAVEIRNVIPVYLVKNLSTFSSSTGSGRAFQDCVMIYSESTTVREVAKMVHPDLDKYFLYAENQNRIRLGENDLITTENNIIKFTTSSTLNNSNPSSE